jgi:N-acyl-D-amino-acid deacylase
MIHHPLRQIRGGLVFDGLGTDPVVADVHIGDDRVARVDPTRRGRGQDAGPGYVDAHGLWVLPGFVDVHSHADFSIFDPQRALLRHAAGVTTEVVGQDGIGPVPCDHTTWLQVSEQLTAVAGPAIGGPWTTAAEYLATARANAHSRVVSFASHGTIRRHVLGGEERQPSADELRRMVELAEACAAEGMPGLSSGLSYPPARAARAAEVRAVYAPFARRGRAYVTHLRDYGEAFEVALDEAAQIAAGGWLHLSHLHVSGPGRAGSADRYLTWIGKQRDAGLRVTFDTYPYTAACTFLASFLPPEALEAPDLARELERNRARHAATLDARGPGQTVAVGWDGFHIVGAHLDGHAVADDTALAHVAAQRGATCGQTVVDLCRENPQGLAVLIEQGHEDNIHALVADEGHTGGSDGIMGAGVPHPRAAGSFLRFLFRAHEGKLPVAVPQMVRRLTSHAADVIGANELGRIRSGAPADLIIIDPARLADGPDRRPHVPDAVRWVIIAGTVVRAGGRPTGRLPQAVVT